MSVIIHPFSPSDAQALVDIYNQARPIEVAQLSLERFWAWFGDSALDPMRDILVAADEQGPLGAVMAFPWPGHLEEGYVFFVGPSVLPEFQHQGVGGRLMAALVENLSRRFPGKLLQTRLESKNEAAHHFLMDQMGFRIDRHFWQMTHFAPGNVAVGDAPEGITFDYLQPEADSSEVIATYRAILDDPLTTNHLLDEQELKTWEGLQNFAANSFLVAKKGPEVVGLCFQTFPPGLDYGQIQFLGVLRPYRGLGLATHMARQALANAHANGKASVRLEVSGDRDVAQALYRKMGFELTSGETFYVRPLPQPLKA